MRSFPDRLRHAISFEALALLIVTPLGAWAFDHALSEIGVIAVVGATLATLWTLLYNWLFDHALNRRTGTTLKTPRVRVLHALLFEAGLLILLAPFIAWFLAVPLLEALIMDVAFAGFYVVYAFAYNWLYDRLFPLPEWSQV
ncbi:PACE efflux transporter [Ponticoccus alexandrii]|uniref:PACE efflux transporter n=1 Tax=Ponticoccus alexandrii TaxID=1943633 RepID=A0ABX7F6A2_9RHOB|nr:PACE efflux transporter [Ponticoccus alexandrii]ETA50533.2 membrane protein [Rhodobacteraceae bacterium PD-2]QRF65908.1 PACE efflux transporter [Ponticoccus alexandrii]